MNNSDNKNNSPLYNEEFRLAMKDVKRIVSDRINPGDFKQRKQPLLSPAIQDEDKVAEYFSDEFEAERVDFEACLKFKQSAISYQQMHDLSRGNMNIEDHLDLHGYTIEQARDELTFFIHHATSNQFRVIKIIHGKGYKKEQKYPLLKNKVNGWLQQHPQVLAFHSALPRDGGTGAVYVLLKNTNKKFNY